MKSNRYRSYRFIKANKSKIFNPNLAKQSEDN